MAKHFTLEDVQAAVEDAITGGEYSIPKIAASLHTSERTFYRRVKELTGNTQGGHLGHSDEPVCQAAVGTSRQATRQNRLNVRFRGGERSVPCFP
mgnify:CR=1 FL=1